MSIWKHNLRFFPLWSSRPWNLFYKSAWYLQFRLTVLKIIFNTSGIMVLRCKLATQRWNEEHLDILRSFAGFKWELLETCWGHSVSSQVWQTSTYYVYLKILIIFSKGVSHLQLEIVCHVMIQSYEKYCRVDLTYDSCDVLIVLILRLSAKDQSFVSKDMNLKNVIAIRKSLCSHLSGLEFMQIHKSSFCLNSRFKLWKQEPCLFTCLICHMGGNFFLT